MKLHNNINVEVDMCFINVFNLISFLISYVKKILRECIWLYANNKSSSHDVRFKFSTYYDHIVYTSNNWLLHVPMTCYSQSCILKRPAIGSTILWTLFQLWPMEKLLFCKSSVMICTINSLTHTRNLQLNFLVWFV